MSQDVPSAPPPPAPPPFRWACVCLPAAGYTCSGLSNQRPALTCNGHVVTLWANISGLSDCSHLSGCDEHGLCEPHWDTVEQYRYASMVSGYRIDLCEPSSPNPPVPPPSLPPPPSPPPPSPHPPDGWCEQLQTAASWSPTQQHQPANAFSALPGIVLGLFQLLCTHTECLHFRSSACWLVVASVGSLIHQ